MKYGSSSLSDVGSKRTHNEDSFVDNPQMGMFAVADGMGGHQAGEVASQIAMDVFSTEIHQRKKLLDAYRHGPTTSLKRQILKMLEEIVLKACKTIWDTAQSDPAKKGMGTTFSAIVFAGRSGFLAHVGDSRIYLVRDGRVHHLTEDHSLLQDHLKKGLLRDEEVEKFPYKNVVTRAVGIMESAQVDTLHMEVTPGDHFLICSDGLYEYIGDEEIPGMFTDRSLGEITKHLIDLANQRGGKDNITAVLIGIPDLPLSEGELEVNRKLDALRKITLFENLSYSELVKVLNIVQIVRKKRGDILIREGEPGDSMYIIANGAVDILKDDVYLTTLESGGHFGEMSLIDNDRRSATVRAAKDCDLLMIDRNDFYHLLHSEAHLSIKVLLNFLGELSGRLRETTRAFSEWKRKINDISIHG